MFDLASKKSCGVWYARGKKYFVVFLLKSIGESQVMVLRIDCNSILINPLFYIVLNVFASGLPVLSASSAQDVGSHSSLVERIPLEKPVDVEPDSCFLTVFD